MFKGDDREKPSCYRPISLLPSLRKLVSNRALEHLNENNLPSKHPFGFCKNFSTDYAVFDIYEKLLSYLDKKN